LKQDASRFGIYSEKFRVSDLVAEAMVNFHPLCIAADHSLSITLERDLGSIQGNASKVRRILLSLLLYLSRQGEEGHISMSVNRRVNKGQALLVFRIEGCAADTTKLTDQNEKHITITEMINRDVGLATCWRFCSSIGARLSMFEGQLTAFELLIPTQLTSNDFH
jgi:hypothetical protein